ncbi:hypothetical protein E2562_028487 [Oryza meyeriana var. granulata]|uniref:Uncharacterized protein n=1 Tax=Oryza meyeriana var. granulata TaxID=110450 RepID=A0A6G1DNI6_9ORYZ|nr:hypothetical protein E2562_028487 [Oryza meyeriana var. granulata]
MEEGSKASDMKKPPPRTGAAEGQGEDFTAKERKEKTRTTMAVVGRDAVKGASTARRWRSKPKEYERLRRKSLGLT